MAVIKCKMCGGDLTLVEGQSVAECEYCGSRQTVPAADNEKKLTLFARANRLRAACEFDKAAGIYESIVADFPEEAEAYWGLVLCKYGIEYVDDPGTGKKIPTCHRSSFDSVMSDSDFEQALENADAVARKVYRDEAKQIEEIRKGIIEVSGKEEPYDIFICYKETAENGDRTLDSVLAQDVYDALTDKGYRVFFSRITLEDKLGVEYEPYIFAALNSAKIMLAFGTDYEYFNAVWVKNEWSRYLKLMAKDKEKHLIPCYKGIDAYDMPKEFARLQAQDFGKVGAIQDLLRGIQKILPHQVEAARDNTVVQQTANISPTLETYLKRVSMFLEDGDWKSANEYCEKVLDADPENVQAYLGKLLAENQAKTLEDLKDCPEPFDSSNNYEKIIRFGEETLKTKLREYTEQIYNRNDQTRKKEVYMLAKKRMSTAIREAEYIIAANQFETISDYADSAELAKNCYSKAKMVKARAEENEAIAHFAKHAIVENGTLKKYRVTKASVCIPKTVTGIGECAFDGNKTLITVTISEGVTSIGDRAFSGCEALTYIAIPSSVTNIGQAVFYGCKSLCEIVVADNNPFYRMVDGCLIDVRRKTIIVGLKGSKIPNDGSVTYIGRSAFSNHSDITSIQLPSSIIGIGKWAFFNCVQLKSIAIPAGVTTIEEGAFADCREIETITIPGNITQIGEQVFRGCENLCNLVVTDGNPFYRMDNGCLIDTRNKKIIFGMADARIPDDGSVEKIGRSAFYGRHELSAITIPDTVTTIEEDAFYDCKSLLEVTIPGSVTSIEQRAFSSCKGLHTVSILEGVKSIGEWAFQFCENLCAVTVPRSVKSISANTFFGCNRSCVLYSPLGSYAQEWTKQFARRNSIKWEEDKVSRQKREEQERIVVQRRIDGLCQHCGGELKGLFSKKCAVCGRPKDY